MQLGTCRSVDFPLAPCFAQIERRSETEFTDAERSFRRFPALWQAIASQRYVAAFLPTVGLAIKMVAKGQRIGHIAFSPIQHI